MGYFLNRLMVIMKLILRFHCLVTHLDHMMVLHWTTIVVFLMKLKMVYFIVQHWVSHLDILMGFCLILIKSSTSAVLMLNCLVLHLELNMNTRMGFINKFSWVLLLVDLIVRKEINIQVSLLGESLISDDVTATG